jgi:sarcosine/dimethylglycine N-methyltransferase
VVQTAQTYYNSSDADRFYATVWGGEDIHVGIYDYVGEPIFDASRRTVQRMAHMVGPIDKTTRIVDVGAGYGGSARYLAATYGCHVTCLNLSEAQNERNRRMNQEQGLADLIEVTDGSFEEMPYDDTSFDVAWSQDAFLHSGNRQLVLQEVRRVLKPGGSLIFTDPMQSDDCPSGVLQPVLDRIHLDTLGSYAFYRQAAREVGFEEVEVVDLSSHLPRHYGRVREELQSRYDELTTVISKSYIDRMLTGLGHWVAKGEEGYLRWGIIHFRAVS